MKSDSVQSTPPQQRKKIIFYFIRHGQTAWNLENRIQGQTDIPLNNLGIAQVSELKKKLGDIVFTRCFSSDLKRASETAQIMMRGQQAKIVLDTRLRERDFRELEGQSSSAYINASTQDLKSIESDFALSERILQFLNKVIDANPNGTFLIVTHGGVIRSILSKLLHLTCRDVEIEIGNRAIMKLLIANENWEIKELCDIHWPQM